MVRMIFDLCCSSLGVDGLEGEEDGILEDLELKRWKKKEQGKEGNGHGIVELSIDQGRLRGTWEQDAEGGTIKRQEQCENARNFLTIY